MHFHRLAGAAAIGLATAILEPVAWRSIAAAVLLVAALNLYLWNVRTRP